MKSDKEKFKSEFKKRMYAWTLSVVRVMDAMPRDINSNTVIAKQLLRSATSVGANYIEAQAASSKKDFTNFIHISLKSANESKYWLALLRDLQKIEKSKADALLLELTEIANILGASILTLKGRK